MTLAIIAEALFDGSTVHRDKVVLVKGEIVSDIVAPSSFDSAQCEKVLRCKFLIPGLIDAHAHISGYIDGHPARNSFGPIKTFLRLLVVNGVTTVRDTGNYIEAIKYAKEWSCRYLGPNIYSSGPLLDSPPLAWGFSRMVRTPLEAENTVAVLHSEGVDFIKAYRNISADQLQSIVTAANKYGLAVAADTPRVDSVTAARAGVRSLEHAFLLSCKPHLDTLRPNGSVPSAGDTLMGWASIGDDDGNCWEELISTLAEHKTIVCPTLLVTRRVALVDEMLSDPYLKFASYVMPFHQHFLHMQSWIGRAIGMRYLKKYMPVANYSNAEKARINLGVRAVGSLIRRLHDRGVPIVCGTDAPNPSIAPGFAVHQELELLVAAGLSPIEALRSATSVAANLLGRKDLGRIAVGGLADLVALRKSPIDSIQNTREIDAVVRRGTIVDLLNVWNLIHRNDERA